MQEKQMQENQLFILLRSRYSFSILITSIGGGTGKPGEHWPSHFFFQGGPCGAQIYVFISAVLPLHECN